jgi:hypothetical protein
MGSTAQELVAQLKEDRTWQELADLLREHGEDRARSYWYGIAKGNFEPSREAVNALRSAVGLPPLPPDPVEVVRGSGVKLALQLHEKPEVALLVQTQGKAPGSVSIRVTEEQLEEFGGNGGPKCRVRTSVPRTRSDTTLSVSQDLKTQLEQYKRDGETWNVFLGELLAAWVMLIEEGFIIE